MSSVSDMLADICYWEVQWLVDLDH